MTGTIATAPFFTIKFGANAQQVFNSDCYLRLLVQSIKYRCNCQENDQLALIDEECQLTDLKVHSKSFENGRSMFTGRGEYVLLLVQCSATGVPQYKSLLDAPYMSRDIAEKLEELNNPQLLQPQVRKVRRVTTVVPFNKSTTPKRKQSMYTRKQPSLKKITPIARITE